MKILALEFSSPQRSVAVLSRLEGGPAVTGTIAGNDVARTKPRLQTSECRAADQLVEVVGTGLSGAQALTMVDEILRDAGLEREQIERLVVGTGPGSYTGIRAAIALAQGWQLARRVKLQGISSAECLVRQAQAASLTGRVSILIDAQRNEFYLARYELRSGECREIEPLRLATHAEVLERQQAGDVLVGPEVTRWFPSSLLMFPSAAMLARMAVDRDDFVPGEKLEPVYLRKADFVKAPQPKILPLEGSAPSLP